MPTLKIYQIDAFTDKLFSGNPAAVVPLDEWPDDDMMQNIANENNLAETAFFVKRNDQYEIRWFTPETEVDLCGHATLASAFVIFTIENFEGKQINFYSPRSGNLTVNKNEDWFELTFPADEIRSIDMDKEFENCFSEKPKAVFKGRSDFMFVFENQAKIENIKPNLEAISRLEARGIIVTAKGNEVDFVSRFFGPKVGVNEDPVTGSAHTTLIPYWSRELEKEEMVAEQLSKRKGFLKCKNQGNKVVISGQAKLYLKGEIFV